MRLLLAILVPFVVFTGSASAACPKEPEDSFATEVAETRSAVVWRDDTTLRGCLFSDGRPLSLALVEEANAQALRLSGRFVAFSYEEWDRYSGRPTTFAAMQLWDLRARRRVRETPATEQFGAGRNASRIALRATGSAAISFAATDDQAAEVWVVPTRGRVQRLDRGVGVRAASLTRRGEYAIWKRGATTKRFRLP